MSRRGSVLEGYQAPDITMPVDILEGQRIVSQERMHNKSLLQQQKQQRAKDLNEKIEITPSTSGTIYDPVGLKATQDLNIKFYEEILHNPGIDPSIIKAKYAKEANDIAQYYQKAKTIKDVSDAELKELAKEKGWNISFIGLKAQQMALLDPQTGKIRADISEIDPNVSWVQKVIETYPLESTTNEALHEYVKNTPKQQTKVTGKIYDKLGGFKQEGLSMTVPSFIHLSKDSKGFNVKNDDGTYSLEPAYELDATGNKLLDKNVYDDVMKNSKATAARVRGEAIQFIKQYNKENGIDKPIDDVEVENVSRKLMYEDLKTIWGDRGVELQKVDKTPQIKNTTNVNIGSGKDNSQSLYNDTWGRIRDYYNKALKRKVDELKALGQNTDEIEKDNKFLISMNKLDTDAINLISSQVNAGRKEEDKINPDDMYVNFTKDGEIKIYEAETDKEKIKKMRIPEWQKNKDKLGFIDDKYLRGTLPPSSNLKTPQANTKAKVKAQTEAKDREKEIDGKKGGASKKSISMSTLKSLEGTKDYKGYSLQEIVDYYKKNGYEVK